MRTPRGRLRDRIQAERAAGAGLVLDDHRLPQILRQFGCQDARAQVDIAAGRERNDQPDRLARRGALRLDR